MPAVSLPSRDRFGGLRGILVLWIVLGHLLLHEHFGHVYPLGFERHEDFGLLGNLLLLRFLGVDIFFVLSGFLLTLTYSDQFGDATKGRDIDRFYLRRLRRIWPLHAAMVAVIGLYEYLGVPHPITSGVGDQIFAYPGWTLALNLTLMNAWGIVPVASWNEPSWTLSVTFLLYVLFPNVILLLKRLPKHAPAYALGIVSMILAYATARFLWDFKSYSDGTGGLVRGFSFFLVGCLTAMFQRSTPESTYFTRYGNTILILFGGLIVLWSYLWQFPLTVFHATYPLLLLALAKMPKPILPLSLSHWLGTRSMAIFLTHYPLLQGLRYAMGPEITAFALQGVWQKGLSYLLVFSAILLAAECGYRAIDQLFVTKQH